MKSKLKWIMVGVLLVVLIGTLGYFIFQKNANNSAKESEPVRESKPSTGVIPKDTKTLIVYYSLTSSTEKVATMLQKKIGGDIYEIEIYKTYPNVVSEVSAEAREERRTGNLPELKGELPNIEDYDLILVGGPVWSMTVCSPLINYLKLTDFNGKDVVGFWTDDAQAGNYFNDFKSQVQNGNVLDGFGMSNVKELSNDKINSNLDSWINDIASLIEK